MSHSQMGMGRVLSGRFVCCIAAIFSLTLTVARGSDWAGGVGSWSSDGIPGWNGTGVPNGRGETAQLVTPPGEFPDTTQDIGGGVTVGSINYGASNDLGAFYWRVGAENGITLDQDGGGIGFATISNSSTNNTDLNALWINGGAVTLADDLHVTNTAGSSLNVNGAIQFDTVLAGTGDITFNSTGPISSTASSSPGAIWLNRTNTFTGSVLVQQGLVTVNNGDGTAVASYTPFGNAANVITIGQTGSGNAAVLSRLSNAPIDYAVVVAPNAVGETRTFGAASNGTFTMSTKSVTLNGDMNLRAGTTSRNAIQTYTGSFSGAGKLNKTGSAVALLSGTNTNTGTTTVSEGTLVFENQVSLYNNTPASWNTTNLIVQSAAAMGFSIGTAGNFTDANILTLNALGSATGGFKAGSFLALNPTVASYTYSNTISNSPGSLVGDYNANGVVDAADFVLWRKNPTAYGGAGGYADWRGNFGASGSVTNSIGFKKVGVNTLVLTGNNTYTGGTDVNRGVLSLGSAGAINSTGTISFTGGTLQHTAVNTTDYSPRFSTAANQAYSIDTNGQNITYATNLVSSGGSLAKLGDGTLTLPGANTYTGVTAVSGGTLKVTGSHTGGTYTVTQNANFVLDAAGSVNSTGAFYVGSNSQGHAVNEGSFTVSGALGVNGYSYDTNENWGLGVGVFGGGEGYFTNSGSGTVSSSVDIRVGDGYGPYAYGEFYQQSSGAVTATNAYGVLTVGNAGGTGKFVKASGSGDVNIAFDAYIGTYGGTGTFTQESGNVTFGVAGGEETFFYQELYLGMGDSLSHGEYDLQGGTLTVNGWSNIGRDGGTGIFDNAGTFITTRELRSGYGDGATGTMNNLVGATLTAERIILGVGASTGLLTNGVGSTITTTGPIQVGYYIGGTGTFTMDGGTVTCGDWVVIGTFGDGFGGGTGHGFQHGGTINTVNFDVAQDLGASGDYTMDEMMSDSEINATGFFAVGGGGLGTFDLVNGDIHVGTGISGVMYMGSGAGSNGTLHQTGGSIVVGDQTYIGLDGNGTYNLDTGDYSTGDNMYVGLNAGGHGIINMIGGTLTVVGNDPSYTGNLNVGTSGIGELHVSAGTVNLAVGNTGTLNSASTSLTNHAADPPANYLDDAKDGNLRIAEAEGTGTVDLSGTGKIYVSGNVFLGGFNGTSFAGGNGTLTITGGEMHVGTTMTGVTSPTGGDMVLGSPVASSTATVNLQGGLLDVTNGTGIIGSGGSASSKTFSFTGGTLKMKEWNTSSIVDMGVGLGNLVQNGAGSVLDVTGNSTLVHSSYDLGIGTATIGNGHTLTADGVINSAGAGVVNVGQGGTTATLTAGAGAIDADTLNLNAGSVVAAAGVNVRTVLSGNGSISNDITLDPGNVTKLAINSISSFDKIIVGGTLNIAGSLQVTLGYTPSAGDEFDVFDFGGLTGTFTSVGPNSWDTTQLYTLGKLKFVSLGSGSALDLGGSVPEPATFVLSGMAIIGLLAARRTRS